MSGSSQNANNVADWFIDNQSVVEDIANYTSVAFALVGEIVNAFHIKLEVSFSDGSIAIYKIDGVNGDGTIDLSLVEATDSENNSIPLTISGYPGTYTFSSNGDGLGNMQRAVNQFGGQLVFGGSGVGGGTITVSCEAKGEVYVCTATVNK